MLKMIAVMIREFYKIVGALLKIRTKKHLFVKPQCNCKNSSKLCQSALLVFQTTKSKFKTLITEFMGILDLTSRKKFAIKNTVKFKNPSSSFFRGACMFPPFLRLRWFYANHRVQTLDIVQSKSAFNGKEGEWGLEPTAKCI